jgi:hypothetical protein
MSQHTTATQPTTREASREPNGRFAVSDAGNSINPYARRVAGLRTAMLAAVSDDDMQAITARLVREARDGNNTSTKLLLQYVVGKPAPAVNPDTLAIDALRLLQQSAVPPEALLPTLRGVPAELWLQLWPLFAEAQAAQLAKLFKAECAKVDEKERRAAERKPEREETAPDAAPLTDGSDGDGTLAAVFGWLRGRCGTPEDGPRT